MEKEISELKNELADERARSIVVQAQEDKAKTLMGRTQREMDHAKDQLVQQQKQAEEHLQEQLEKLRASLQGELSGAHKTIAEYKEKIALLEAEKIKAEAREKKLKKEEAEGGNALKLAAKFADGLKKGGSGSGDDGRPGSGDGEKGKSGKKQKKKSMSILGNVDFDESRPLGEQLKEALSSQALRVMDLFRDWDENGDGQISKAEFRQAMPLLGYDLPPEEIDKVFNEYDPGTPASIIHTYQCPAPRLLTLAIPLLCACCRRLGNTGLPGAAEDASAAGATWPGGEQAPRGQGCAQAGGRSEAQVRRRVYWHVNGIMKRFVKKRTLQFLY